MSATPDDTRTQQDKPKLKILFSSFEPPKPFPKVNHSINLDRVDGITFVEHSLSARMKRAVDKIKRPSVVSSVTIKKEIVIVHPDSKTAMDKNPDLIKLQRMKNLSIQLTPAFKKENVRGRSRTVDDINLKPKSFKRCATPHPSPNSSD